tara:strand:+ start:22993 stop:23352 length:360 start_codon:yes stop_codon:yes gene_type:complete
MGIVLSEWVEEQPRNRIANIGSRGIKLPYATIHSTLSQMGEVMSLHKIHRKIAVFHAIKNDMEINEVLSAENIRDKANKYTRCQNLNTRQVAGILKLIAKWGIVEVRRSRTVHEYRRVV